jgi:TonB family protein
MNFRKNQALWTAVILHIVVLVGLFLGTIVEVFRPKEKLHVFEMVEPASEQSSSQSAAQSAPPPSNDLPTFEPMDIPDPVLPEPAPTPPISTRPEPTPVPAKPTLTHTPPAKPKLIPYDQFRKDNPLKSAKPQSQQVAPSKVAKVVIQTPKWQIMSGNPSSSDQSRAMSAAEQTALQRYGSQLNARLNRAWIKPANLSGVRLTVQVQFNVSSSGRISSIRLRPSSGNGTFDQSVLAAFAKVGSGGVTPTGQSHSFTMAFKMVD